MKLKSLMWQRNADNSSLQSLGRKEKLEIYPIGIDVHNEMEKK